MTGPGTFELRPVDVESPTEIATAFELVRDCEVAAAGWTDSTLESTRALLTGPGAWRERHRFALVDGHPQALLAAELDHDSREIFLDAFAVGPQAAALQTALLADGLAAAGDVARQDAASSAKGVEDPYALTAAFWQVVAGAISEDAAYVAVLETLGFRPIRRFWRMLCDLAGTSAVEPPPPPGVTRRPVVGEADERVLHRLFHDSFAAHFGHTAEDSYEDWMAKVRAHPGNRVDGWWLAELDGVPVGLCIVDDSMVEFDEGYVRTLGVIDSARGRGIGRWLLKCAAADAVARGRAAIALAVDGANTTGATALYESVGYRIRQEFDVFCYPLLDSALSRNVSPQT